MPRYTLMIKLQKVLILHLHLSVSLFSFRAFHFAFYDATLEFCLSTQLPSSYAQYMNLLGVNAQSNGIFNGRTTCEGTYHTVTSSRHLQF